MGNPEIVNWLPIIPIERARPTGTTVHALVNRLHNEDLAVVPTETQYALCALATADAAVEAVCRLKGRLGDHPLSAFFRHFDDLRRWGIRVPDHATALAERFWPGPMTLVLPAEGALARRLGSPKSVGVRVSPEPIIRRMLEKLDAPVVATSANPSGASMSVAQENRWLQSLAQVHEILWLRPARYVRKTPSTVVDCTGPVPRQLRAGAISVDDWKGALS
ncbi:MAG: threonylcarbamoyl-AMP synthase [candidate division Zixibacteria bacterium]|nr:threonylcarbamoyl-AMP synthase [candidate division Zixibacteria bacterium]